MKAFLHQYLPTHALLSTSTREALLVVPLAKEALLHPEEGFLGCGTSAVELYLLSSA